MKYKKQIYVFVTDDGDCDGSEWECPVSWEWSLRSYKAKTLCISNLKIRILSSKEEDDPYWGGFPARSKREKTRLRNLDLNRHRQYIAGKGYKIKEGVKLR
jgi:hypothetical protein